MLGAWPSRLRALRLSQSFLPRTNLSSLHTATPNASMKWKDLFKKEEQPTEEATTPPPDPSPEDPTQSTDYRLFCTTLVHKSSAAIFAKDMETQRYTFANPAFMALLGKTKLGQVVGRKNHDLFGQETAQLWSAHEDKLVQSNDEQKVYQTDRFPDLDHILPMV